MNVIDWSSVFFELEVYGVMV